MTIKKITRLHPEEIMLSVHAETESEAMAEITNIGGTLASVGCFEFTDQPVKFCAIGHIAGGQAMFENLKAMGWNQ